VNEFERAVQILLANVEVHARKVQGLTNSEAKKVYE
jgi:hypothetical protein